MADVKKNELNNSKPKRKKKEQNEEGRGRKRNMDALFLELKTHSFHFKLIYYILKNYMFVCGFLSFCAHSNSHIFNLIGHHLSDMPCNY